MKPELLKGPWAGWTYGGLGALIRLPVLGGVLPALGRYWAGLAAMVFFGAGLGYLVSFAPWKHPKTPLGLLYSGLAGLILLAAVVICMLWLPWSQVRDNAGTVWFILIPGLFGLVVSLFIPVVIFGRKRWHDLHEQE